MATLDAELEFVKALAAEAATIALARARGSRPQEKANLSYVTDLDHDLERLIRDRLAARFPDDVLTGEEYAAAGGTGPRRWSIDPIDGTGNLVHGLPLWAVSIGLIDAGEPVLGVIAIPPLGRAVLGRRGQGAWRDGERLEVARRRRVPQPGQRLRRHQRPAGRRPADRSPAGSATWEAPAARSRFTACNRLQACTFLGEATHDVAAGIVIAAEAGCRFGTIDGRVLTPAEMVAETPVTRPTFVAPPRRLAALMASARRLA